MRHAQSRGGDLADSAEICILGFPTDQECVGICKSHDKLYQSNSDSEGGCFSMKP